MTPKEDLKKKIDYLEDQLQSTRASLYAILIKEYELQPGDVVETRRGQFAISSVQIKYGAPQAFGKKFLKDGALGKQEFEIYGSFKKSEEK